MDQRMKDDLDRHITGNYGEDQFRENDSENRDDDLDEEIILNPVVKERIGAVSEAWNALIFKSGKDEINRRNRGDSYYMNPIVTGLSENGDLIPLSDALHKLFELA